jgi:hypothetical protein
MKNKRFIVYQGVITSKERKDSYTEEDVSFFIRNVRAKTDHEALGKFVLEIEPEKYAHALKPGIIELDYLAKID